MVRRACRSLVIGGGAVVGDVAPKRVGMVAAVSSLATWYAGRGCRNGRGWVGEWAWLSKWVPLSFRTGTVVEVGLSMGVVVEIGAAGSSNGGGWVGVSWVWVVVKQPWALGVVWGWVGIGTGLRNPWVSAAGWPGVRVRVGFIQPSPNPYPPNGLTGYPASSNSARNGL